jgi:hypothetical protein
MRTDRLLPKRMELRSSTHLNNLIEWGHRGIKSRTRPMLGFKNFASAATTITGIELLRRIHKDQFALTSLRIKNKLQDACALEHGAVGLGFRNPARLLPHDQSGICTRAILSPDTVFCVDISWLPSIPCSQRKRQTHKDGSGDDSQHERETIESALAQSRGRISGQRGAAARLGLPPSTLNSLIKKLKIRKNRFKLG